VTPDWFLKTLETILSTETPIPNTPTLKFELSLEAADHNMNLLQNHGNSIQNYIINNTGTFMSFGSEFRKPEVLEPLLLHHPNWRRCRDLLLRGSGWELYPLTNEDRLAKNNDFITRGNHKSASTYEAELQKIVTQEVHQGWMLPLPFILHSIPSSWRDSSCRY
jgi:hypothetical protein